MWLALTFRRILYCVLLLLLAESYYICQAGFQLAILLPSAGAGITHVCLHTWLGLHTCVSTAGLHAPLCFSVFHVLYREDGWPEETPKSYNIVSKEAVRHWCLWNPFSIILWRWLSNLPKAQRAQRLDNLAVSDDDRLIANLEGVSACLNFANRSI